MLNQDEQPNCFPTVHAIVDLPAAYLIVVEKIPNAVDDTHFDSIAYIEDRLLLEKSLDPHFKDLNFLIDKVRHLQSDVGGNFDSYPGNFMTRDDGTLVFIDPLW